MIKIKIKITIVREPSKLGIFIRKNVNKLQRYIVNIGKSLIGKYNMTKSKLEKFMEDKGITEDYLLGVLAGMSTIEQAEEPEVPETPEEPEVPPAEPAAPEEPAEPEEPEKTIGELTAEKVQEIITSTIESTLKVHAKSYKKTST